MFDRPRRAVHDFEENIFQVGAADLEVFRRAARVAKHAEDRLDLTRIVQIKAHDAHEVERILGVLRAAGCVPEDLEIGRADLEDVFLEIMQGVE